MKGLRHDLHLLHRFVWPAVMLALMMSTLLSLPVRGAEKSAPDDAQSYGALEIVLEEIDERHPAENTGFALYRVADWKNGRLIYLKDYQACTLQSDDLDHPDAMKKALALIKEKLPVQQGSEKPAGSVEASGRSDRQGRLMLPVHAPGLFCLRVYDPAHYGRIDELLVMLPAYDPSSHEMKRTLSISPKASVPSLLQIHKVDAENKTITGAPFVFCAWSDEKKTETVYEEQGDKTSGLASFSLAFGEKVWIGESSAPEGYQLSDRLIEVELRRDGIYVIEGKEVQDAGKPIVLDYVNEKEDEKDLDITSDEPSDSGTSNASSSSMSDQSKHSDRSESLDSNGGGGSKNQTSSSKSGASPVSTAAFSHLFLAAGAFFFAWSAVMFFVSIERRRTRKDNQPR